MSGQMTWRQLAVRLAERMRHHAHCAAHPRNQADPENCPFCDDRAAFDAYLAKADKRSEETP